MGKIDRKRKKLVDRINEMEQDLITSLTKKTSDTAEISLPTQQRRIAELKEKLKNL
jgi:phage-related protein